MRDRWRDFNSGGFSAGSNRTTGSPCQWSAGVREIRVRTDLEHRVIYYLAKFNEAVYVLHAFQKRSQRTPKPDLDLARQRLRELLKQRGQRGR